MGNSWNGKQKLHMYDEVWTMHELHDHVFVELIVCLQAAVLARGGGGG